MLNENIPMYLFHQGTNAKAYEYLGSHRDEEDENFTYFRVWAPHAVAVFVACDRNNWTGEGFELSRINEQGLWEGHFEGFKEFDAYKYLIIAQDGRKLMKCDPYAFHAETRPGTASKIYELGPSARGCDMPTATRSLLASSRTGSCPMLSTWATRTWSCCR